MESYSDGKRRPRRGLPSAANAAQGPNLFDDPPTASVTEPRARSTDPATSHRAARKAAGNDLSDTQRHVLWLVKRVGDKGETDDALVHWWTADGVLTLGWPKKTPQRIRTARADLVRLGYVKDSGRTGTSAYGNDATLWVATGKEPPPAK